MPSAPSPPGQIGLVARVPPAGVSRATVSIHVRAEGIDRARVRVTLDGNAAALDPAARHEEDGALFKVSGVVPGTHTLLVAAPGYQPARRIVQLSPGESAKVTVTLQLQARLPVAPRTIPPRTQTP